MNRKYNAVYLCGGFPISETPTRSVFNKRAAEAISEHVNLTVISYRTWIPGRPFYQKIVESKYEIIILYIPFNVLGGLKWFKFNFYLFFLFTIWNCSNVFETTDVLHAGDSSFFYLASKLKEKYGFKVLLQGIGGDINQELPKLRNLNLIGNHLKNINGFSFNSKALEERFINNFGDIRPRKVIYRGCDLKKFHMYERKHSNGITFLYLGGLPDYKNCDHRNNTKGGYDLMRAWSEIESQLINVDVKLLFAGPQTPTKGLVKWKKGLNFPHLVELLGEVPFNDVSTLMGQSSVLIVPSREEGLPNTAMEASASGLAVLGSKAGGIPELIEDNVSGLLYQPGNIKELATRLLYLVNNQSKIVEFGTNARKKMEVQFNSNNFGSSYYKYYLEILN